MCRCTRLRLAAQLLARVRRLNPAAHLCFYGLYAPVNEAYLRGAGVQTILGGEFEEGLARLFTHLVTQKDKGVNGERAGSAVRADFRNQPSRWNASTFWCRTATDCLPLSKYARTCCCRVVDRWLRVTPKLAEGVNIFAATARLCPCTTGRFASCSARWCWKTSAARWPWALNISVSAIPISSMVLLMAWLLSKRCIANFPGQLRRHHQDRTPAVAP